MEQKKRLLLFIFFASFLRTSVGCTIAGGIQLGPFPHSETIYDTHDGIIRSEATTDIDRISAISYGGGLIGSEPYLHITLEDSQFVIQTSSAFREYEQQETALSFSVTISFTCTSGNVLPLILIVQIIDTNNHSPEFIPSEFEFVLTPPVPPGFLLTGCLEEIKAKDIDLTTSRIIFEIEDNPYFEIEYDADPCPEAAVKEFKAQLRTSSFIRTFREPVTLIITATDVDDTGDDPKTTSTSLRITGDPSFEFPEEPIFSQTLYFANYTNDHRLIQHETIFLEQGFDANVIFTLNGELRSHFSISAVESNQVFIDVITPLPVDVLVGTQIYLVLRADKEYTSGDSASIVIHLPEETPLLFESALYEGSIVDNTLDLSPLVLSQGYEGVEVTAEIVGEYSTSFTAVVEENLVTITMAPQIDDVIENNTFILILIVVSTDRSNATTIVSLEIIKDDNRTPKFDKSLYTGSYDPLNGLNIEQITFEQGFDGTVAVDLVGEHQNLFQLNEIGPSIQLTSSTIPPELFEEQYITLSIEATKPRTVGANAAIIIFLPAARQLDFEEPSYRGTIQDNEVTHTTILLRDGYDQDVHFSHSGDYSSYFYITNVQNQVTITLLSPLPTDVITQNTVIMLTLTASGPNSITATTSVLLDIIKDDTLTPVLSQNIYYGTYLGPSNLEIENIYLSQGFDSEVSFRLDDSAHAQYFNIDNTENNVTITLRSDIPEDVIFNEKVLLFNVLADKALTVGSNAAILIRFPAALTESAVMRFSQNYYAGTLEQNEITLENIILSTGYATGTEFVLSGDYAEYFNIININPNVVQITSSDTNTLPPQVVEDHRYIILTVEARRPRAVSVWTSVIIDIVTADIVDPVFNQAFYRGLYTEQNLLQFEEIITLSEGYDETVSFHLEGEQSSWFSLINNSNSVTLVLSSQISETVLTNNNQLLFTIFALKADGTRGRAVISIDLPNENLEPAILLFEHVTYLGSVENNQSTIPPITLSEGYAPGVLFELHGELKSYFTITPQGAVVTVELDTPIPESSIPANQIIILQIQASLAGALPAYASLVLQQVVPEDTASAVELIFAQTYYTGTYSSTAGVGLSFTTPISLSEGYDANVQFALEGDASEWFSLDGPDNFHTLVLSSPIPVAVLGNNQHLVFVVNAQRPGSTTARATIVISLTDEYTEDLILGFELVTYSGFIENDQSTIPPITLSEGYSPGVLFELHGELKSYFTVSPQGAVVTVALDTPIPESSIPANRIIILQIQASLAGALPAYASLVLQHVVPEDTASAVELIFAQTYYTGTYSSTAGVGLSFTTPISLSEGYDANVQFALEGDASEWFSLDGPDNFQTLVLSSPIPVAVLGNNQQLVFVVNAQRPGSTTARATIVISLTDEYTEDLILGFDLVTYSGFIENDQSTIPPITLSEGYSPGVLFELHGELKSYFTVSPQGAVVTVALDTPIPESSIPANRIIILQIQASLAGALPAYASLVLQHVVPEDTASAVELIFAQTYYTGTYSSTAGVGLSFTTPISLSEGYDANVQLALEGDASEWFSLDGPDNFQTLVLSSPIPVAVLGNNQQLVFVVNAQRPGSTTARATIVISLTDEYTEDLILGFDLVTYSGFIENDQSTIPPITLSEGYAPGVLFELHGELKSYFTVSPQGAVVTVALDTPIPESSIPANRIIILQIQASLAGALPAYASLVLQHVVPEDTASAVELIFAQTYYTGTYSSTAGVGLSFTTPISLSEGYDANVQFALEGDASEWFSLDGPDNFQTLVLSSPIPVAVLGNNQQLVFVVNAQRPGSTTARATIVISLTDEYTEDLILGFDLVTYSGFIENDQSTIPPITLSEGYSPGVLFELHGELKSYFTVSPQGAVVTVALDTPIPESSIPANRIIILQIQASLAGALPAYASLVLQHVVPEDTASAVELIFAQTYYTGTYSSTAGVGLSFTTPISLSEGYDANVQFALEGDASEWFSLDGPDNFQTLVLSSPIPVAVLGNNQQLVFVVNAQRPGSTTARATIVISLTDEYTEDLILGFDLVTYSGFIENDQSTIPPITLSEGYAPGVLFELHGELKSYFTVSPQGAVVTVALDTPIPESSIPANRIIILQIQASLAGALPAYASLVLQHVVPEDTASAVELIFAQTYYTGTYSSTAGVGLSFTTPISLSEGYDANVQFALEGDASEWFSLDGPDNFQTLVLSSPIPVAVLGNNQQLVFVVNAQRPGSTTARATIVISLTDEYTEDLILGFDLVTYSGFIENDQSTIPPITLSEGYAPGVLFELHGELKSYFTVSPQGAVVTVALDTPIPESSIPANRIIILQIQASLAGALPAYASLVLQHVVPEDTASAVELIFAQTYYTGTYSSTAGVGLSFTTPISLSEGYDANVQFALEGDASEWFSLDGPDNSHTLVLSSPIPVAVLGNNQQLIFVVNAQRSGSTTARATIIISLGADSTGTDVSFDRVVYEGVIQNSVVTHEIITVTGFTGTNIGLGGEYSSLFEADITSNELTVRFAASFTLPADLTHLTLELQAGSARAVLVLAVSHTEVPTPTVPVVTFSSASYAIRVEITDTGLVGQVQASADTGETVRYSLQLGNVHLQERLSINDGGELRLSASVNRGLYAFQVVATTIFTQESGTATVHLSAEDIITMSPLVVLDRDEEEPHYNLIDLHEGCHFNLSNRWPLDQTWLYVDDTGLHTTAIDREHESIAFMAVSQVQVEITLHCDTDALATRAKRSLNSEMYVSGDYGTSKWVLTDSIPYNSKRSLVNLIVNDINDNAPVFVGKEQEPIAVGYPVPELEVRVLPRSLIELQATDADIGENAELLYWSSEAVLAVAPATGFVHIRDGVTVENNAYLTVNATDRNGEGLTGSIDILVKLLDASNILVVTIRDAFLDNETNILSRLSESVGYDIKVLRSIVVSEDEANEGGTRKKREVFSATGASLQLYLYGLIEREPVSIERLTADITGTVIAQVNIASAISLEDHLAGQEICVVPGRDTGLLVATIVLSVLLFIIIVLIAVWFFLRWRRKQNYDQFSDANSLASRNESVDQFPQPVNVVSKPRLNIEELKKSERRLQEMLDTPTQQVIVEPTTTKQDSILDMPLPPDPHAPMVIQSIDKLKDAADDTSDDEFGEVKRPKRKSVVTFNENVEKIIHVEDNEDIEEESPNSLFEVYKL